MYERYLNLTKWIIETHLHRNNITNALIDHSSMLYMAGVKSKVAVSLFHH